MKIGTTSGVCRVSPLSLLLLAAGLVVPSLFGQVRYRDRVAWGFEGSSTHLPAGISYRLEHGREIQVHAKHWVIDNSLWSVQDGHLTVRVVQDPPYSVPRAIHLITDEFWGFGRFEVRARFRQDTGANLALWLQSTPGAWPEIDIVEGYGRFKGLDRVSQGAYSGGYDNLWESRRDTDVPNPEDWHTYACEYIPNRITFYIDGEETLVAQGFPSPVQPVQFILSGSAGRWNGVPEDGTIDARMDVDWMVYTAHPFSTVWEAR